MLILYVASDNLICWDEMRRASDGQYVNDATVTFVLKDTAGTTIASGSLAYTLNEGRYDGILSSTVALTRGETYYLEVTAVSGDADAFRRIECVAMHQDDD